MQRKMWQKWIGILFLLFFSLNVSYFGVTLLRSDEFYTGLETDLKNNNLKMEETKRIIDQQYTDIDINNRDQRWTLEGYKISFNYFYYYVILEKYLIDNKGENLLIELPELYGKIHALKRMHNIVERASSRSLGESVTLMYPFITEWIEKGGKMEGNWWERFEKSQEYKDYILFMITDRKNEKGESIDQIVGKIENKEIIHHSPILDNVLNYWVIGVEKKVAGNAYKNYKKHVEKEDYVSALVDINMIIAIDEDLNEVEKLDLMSYLIMNPRYFIAFDFAKSQLIFDLIFIIILSSILFLILYLIMKKIFKRFSCETI